MKYFAKEGHDRLFVIEPEFANVSRWDGINVNIHRCSLSDIDAVKNILVLNKIDVVVHLVSTLIPGSGYDDFNNEFKNMIFPSIRLMEICATMKIKFVYFSSGGTIYGNRTSMQPFVETDEMAPISYYGWSKQMMENSILFKNRTERLKYLTGAEMLATYHSIIETVKFHGSFIWNFIETFFKNIFNGYRN